MAKIAIIRVNLASENVLPDGNILGKVGEHNANILEITPPDDMTENENIKLYCLAFEVGRDFIKRIVRSEMIPKANVFQISLWSQVTVGENVKFQLEAYDGESNLLIKSQLVEGVFLPSVNGVNSQFDSSQDGISASVAANTLARHTHENADVLNALADDNGNLTYNGQAIGGAVARATAQKEFTINDDNLSWIAEGGGNEKTFYLSFYEEDTNIPNGTEIADVEFMICNSEKVPNDVYISLNEMFRYGALPCIPMNKRTYFDDSQDHVVIAIYFPCGVNDVIAEVNNWNWTSVRITYYKD